VATRSLKRATIWQNDFKEKGDFNQKICAVSPIVEFLPPKKNLLQNKLAHLEVLVNYL
jgi:hypothetical protein